MKLFRKLEVGPNPDVEMSRFLTERGFANTPRARALLVVETGNDQAALAYFQEFVPNQGNAFDLTRDAAILTLESVLARREELGPAPKTRHLLEVTKKDTETGEEVMGASLVDATNLGRRTGEMHLALIAPGSNSAFAPEPLSTLQQRSIYQAIRTSVRSNIGLLRRRRSHLRDQDLELADLVIQSEAGLLEQLRSVTAERIECDRIRIHGDYHLGQVLYTGNDFYIIDFEGEPQHPLSQRRLKRLGLQDVAGMIRSYHYAMVMALQQVLETELDEEARVELTGWAHAMHRWASAAFFSGYLEVVDGSPVVPSGREHLRTLLDALVLEKASYELGYELNNRPDWVGIPMQGIIETIL